MRVLVTGAGGFIGATLLQLLHARRRVGDRPLEQLAACDTQWAALPADVVRIEGDLAHAQVRERIAAFAPDVCFHLAAVPGGAAEADRTLSRRVNLDASLDLFETLAVAAAKRSADKGPPIVVYASTIAVYGHPLPDLVSPTTPTRPPMTYGAHKLACEIVLADYTRRGLLDGRSLRLPGIVARPRAPSGLVSAFMSDVMHALRAGEGFICPVAPAATGWWMSARRCAQNLLHAAVMDPGAGGADDGSRAWVLPVLRLSMAEVVQTLSTVYGVDGDQLVGYEPQAAVEAVLGRYPPLDDRAARALGLRDDGTPAALVQRALEPGFELAEEDDAWR
ncbi:NAD-dependent epimerase/dehydratase family protein [Variovorax sp. J22R24]|uniref:NAD-dependent epimerase/dehydratase family protein n=1 Tax=Variovorax gracilis TaxID=3053502 RepID=UPI00257641C2|nr:NAD-dependent epimerase/dehydratase family protein [Variovorax sp. J22R24]MDM0107598.1 NAD-dependent epimerase/dehydratase family protein [Variovorax sp. J22R24]